MIKCNENQSKKNVKNMKKKKSIMILLMILLSSIIVSNTKDLLIVNDTTDLVEHPQLKLNSFYNLTGPIYIDDADPNYNWSKTVADNEWCSGSGTPSDPYIIEDVYMNKTGIDPSITIKNSNNYFMIRNCSIYRTGGMYFKSVSHGSLSENNFTWLYSSLMMEDCHDITIFNNKMEMLGITYFNSSDNTIENNIFVNSEIFIDESNHTSIVNNELRGYSIPGFLTHGSARIFITASDLYRESNNNLISGNSIVISNAYMEYSCIDLRIGNGNSIINNNITLLYGTKSDYRTIGIKCGTHSANLIENNRLYGLGFSTYYSSDFIEKNHFINNYVNNKYFYYYINKTNLGDTDFGNAGQIILKNCNNSIIQNQILTNATTGIDLYNCFDIMINANDLSYNHRIGVSSNGCRNITIYENSVNHCRTGIYLSISSFCTLTLNNISHSELGIFLGGNNNTIVENFIFNNKKGLALGEISGYNSVNQAINQNDFYNNTSAVYVVDGGGIFNFSENIVRNNTEGIYIGGKSGVKNYFINNTIEYNTNYGLQIYYTNDTNEINGNIIRFNKNGLEILAAHNTIIKNNILLSNQVGLRLRSDESVITNNRFIDNNDYGIYLDFRYHWDTHCENNMITDNSFYGCGLGVSESPINDVTVMNLIDETNLVNGKPLRFFVNESGVGSVIDVSLAGQIVLINCTTPDLEVIDISNTSIGIIMSYCDDARIWKLNCNSNKLHGIYLYRCDNVSISDSIISYNKGAGIHTNEGTNINVFDNKINSNDEGIYLYKSSYNLFKSNEIFDNFATGINITTTASKNNKIYLNHFNNPNNINAIDNGDNNEWDNGSIGNEWYDYDGFDCDGDGIGETPYISVSIIDNFPICYNLDTFNPKITILSPEDDEVFSEDSPTLSITIEEYILWGFWYTLDGGGHNFTSVGDLSEAQININKAFWDNLNDGEYLLEVYAKDIAGNVGYAMITIIKDIPDEIPIELIIVGSVIGAGVLIGVALVVLIRRKRK